MKCMDCPHLDADYLRERGITPPATCCVDRMPAHRALEARMAAAKAAGEGLAIPRHQRRRAERNASKGKPQ